jgi:hypothetical protein
MWIRTISADNKEILINLDKIESISFLCQKNETILIPAADPEGAAYTIKGTPDRIFELLEQKGMVEVLPLPREEDKNDLDNTPKSIDYISEEDMELINKFAYKPLTPDDVYVFSIKLCDSEHDRDNERFTWSALQDIKELAIGKQGIIDRGCAKNSIIARIFDTTFYTNTGFDKDGNPKYCFDKDGNPKYWVEAKAYMIRNADTEEVIKEINAGIKKEVSISCSCFDMVCSVCGSKWGHCQHTKGEYYDDTICIKEIQTVQDLYEWSFVVPPVHSEKSKVKRYANE